ncbi:MAG: dihydroxy-acid dehydratase, partial [Limisphaerales bacterium]
MNDTELKIVSQSSLRSNFESGSTRWAVRRAQWIAMGIDENDFKKPKIAVINSSSGLSICYQHLDECARDAAAAIRRAGGLPFEIRTVAPSDFVTSAGKKARYLMPSRDLLVNDVEVMVEGAELDGVLFLASCDKTTPGQLMAAARLNIPSIVVPCGYQLGGNCGGRSVDIEEVYKAVGTVKTGRMSIDELSDWTRCAIKGPGVCAGLATANSMHCLTEALGMALPGTTPIRAGSDRLKEALAAAGTQIVKLVEKDIRPRQILTKRAIENAVRVAVSIGCSVNTLRHLTAIAFEAGLDLDVVSIFERVSLTLPQITNIRPNGPDRIEQFDAAGGTLAVLHRLKSRLALDTVTVTGDSLGSILENPVHIDSNIIKTLDEPFNKEPGLIILRGNLAPDGAIVKLSAVPKAMRVFDGPARIFEDEDKAIAELGTGSIKPGDVVVLRQMGPFGGPGTVFACSFMAALAGAKLDDKVSVVTDGELSGLNKGITIGQVMPEAACGGPLAIVRDGEKISINLLERRIDLKISAQEIARRLHEWKPLHRNLPQSWLKIYAENVSSLNSGAVVCG